MLPYWLLFLIPALGALQERSLQLGPRRRGSPVLAATAVLMSIAIGFRFRVGGDWWSYLAYLHRAEFLSFSEALTQRDPGYILLNWLAANTFGEIWVVNFLCGAIFSWGLLAFAKQQPRPWLALLVAVPYLVIVVAMGYSRQAVAIGLAMLGLVALTRDRSLLKFVLWVALAATFHRTAVILIPIAALATDRGRLWTAAWVGAAAAILYYLLLYDSVDRFMYGYIERGYQSEGAAVRIAMNALPAAIFLLARRRFPLAPGERRPWMLMAAVAVGCIGLLAVSPSSTAVDRLALYLVPLQVFVLSRFPDAFAPRLADRATIAFGVIAYSAVVQFVWLNFAHNARSWLPYQFYLMS